MSESIFRKRPHLTSATIMDVVYGVPAGIIPTMKYKVAQSYWWLDDYVLFVRKPTAQQLKEFAIWQQEKGVVLFG